MFDWDVQSGSDADLEGVYGGEIDLDRSGEIVNGSRGRHDIDVRVAETRTEAPVTLAGEVRLEDLPMPRVDAFARLVRPILMLLAGLAIIAILIMAAILDFRGGKLSLREVYGVLGGAVLGILGRDSVLKPRKARKGR